MLETENERVDNDKHQNERWSCLNEFFAKNMRRIKNASQSRSEQKWGNIWQIKHKARKPE